MQIWISTRGVPTCRDARDDCRATRDCTVAVPVPAETTAWDPFTRLMAAALHPLAPPTLPSGCLVAAVCWPTSLCTTRTQYKSPLGATQAPTSFGAAYSQWPMRHALTTRILKHSTSSPLDGQGLIHMPWMDMEHLRTANFLRGKPRPRCFCQCYPCTVYVQFCHYVDSHSCAS